MTNPMNSKSYSIPGEEEQRDVEIQESLAEVTEDQRVPKVEARGHHVISIRMSISTSLIINSD